MFNILPKGHVITKKYTTADIVKIEEENRELKAQLKFMREDSSAVQVMMKTRVDDLEDYQWSSLSEMGADILESINTMRRKATDKNIELEKTVAIQASEMKAKDDTVMILSGRHNYLTDFVIEPLKEQLRLATNNSLTMLKETLAKMPTITIDGSLIQNSISTSSNAGGK